MIIIKLKGGLGNQMFQYAAGLAVATAQDEELKLDTTGYEDPRYVKTVTPRKYRLFTFNISASIATPEEVQMLRNPLGVISRGIRFFNQKVLRKFYIDYDPKIFKKKHNYIEGFFQSEKNFIPVKDRISREFTLKKEFESEIFLTEKSKIDKEKSVSVHIRRGDYVNDPKTQSIHEVCSKEYYAHAISLVRSKISNPIFYFFSDDILWVKKEFGEHADFRYVSNPGLEDYEELFLMASCVHNIIANSSFSWWGAYLNKNPNKMVIAPKKWAQKVPDQHPNIIPNGWIRI